MLAKNVGKAMGINSFYLASDNKTVITDATMNFPEMNWFSQSRPLTEYTGGLYTQFYEDSKKKDISDILADLIVMSRCSALIASFDSGFAHFLEQYGCSRNKQGRCRPQFTLYDLGMVVGNEFYPVTERPTFKSTQAPTVAPIRVSNSSTEKPS